MKEMESSGGNETNKAHEKALQKSVVNVAELEQNSQDPKTQTLNSDCETSKVEPEVARQDTPDVPLRVQEKKRLHWSGKTCTFIVF